MKLLLAASVILGVVAPPAQAATLDDPPRLGRDAHVGVGTFAGARLRISLGGDARRTPKLRAGLTLAPQAAGRAADGRSIQRIGPGLEYGFTGDRIAPRLSFAGHDLGTRRDASGGEKKARGGPSTAVYIIGGVVIAVGIGVLLLNDALSDASD